MYCLDCQLFISMFNIKPRRKENSPKVCVVTWFHIKMHISVPRRKEKKGKTCVVAIREKKKAAHIVYCLIFEDCHGLKASQWRLD